MIFANLGSWIKQTINKVAISFEQIQLGRYFDCLVISIIVAIAFFSFGPGLDSSWGILDDHEIKLFSPSYHPLGFSELIPTLLTKTEIDPNSTLARFRPAYYALRLLETRIWSAESPFPWYLARIILFIFFIGIMYLFFKSINGRIIGGLLAIIITTFDFWNDIFSRLGPAETYAILGLCFFLIGILILHKNKNSNFAWLLIALGTIISIGSKENMVVFLLPEIYLAVFYFRKPLKTNAFPLAMLAFSIIWIIWIFTTVLARIKSNGSDVYENSVGLIGQLSIIGNKVTQNILLSAFIGLLLTIGILGFLFTKNSTLKPWFRNLVLGLLGILVLVFSQEIFYSGTIEGRYNFPYALYFPFTISLAANLIQNFPLFHNKFFYYFTSLTISVVILIFFIHPTKLLYLRKIATIYASKTQQFESKIHRIDYYLSTNPSSPIVLFCNNPESDFEKCVSIIRFIRSDAFSNDIFIFTDPPADFETTYSKLGVSLENQLMQWSHNGKPDEGIMPINEFDRSSPNCLLITFSEEQQDSILCDSVINVKW